jgi:hypothetical protein
MSNLGRQLGQKRFRNLPRGVQIDPKTVPQKQDIFYGQFTGIDESSSPSLVPFSAGILGTIDVEMSPDNSLMRAPGVVLVEDSVVHSFKYAFTQTDPSGAVELFVVDPPWIGVRTVNTIWTNVGLAATGTYGWVAANHGGVELFSNGVGNLHYRLYGVAGIGTLGIVPACRSVASIFGRVFIAAPVIAGNFENLQIQWSDSSGAYDGWDPTLGAGAEDLITDLAWADRIVALRPLGRDLLCIFMRNSIWIGVRTGEFDRPADFRPIKGGIGCVWEATARTTKDGVMFLSDDGVHLFDGNEEILVSDEINEELIPLNFDNLKGYHAAYDPYRKRYILTTPAATWVYEFAQPRIQRAARWYKRSFVADSVFSYSDQAADPTWDDANDTWDSTGEGTWDADIALSFDAPSRLFFAADTRLGREDYANFRYFDTDFTGIWRGTPGLRQTLSGLVLVHAYEFEYKSGGRILLSTPDVEGNWVARDAVILPDQGSNYSGEMIEIMSEGLPGLEIALLPPVTSDILVSDLIVEPGETVTLISPSATPGDITSEVLGDGVLITLDVPGPFISPQIARVRQTVTPSGPKMTSRITKL